MRFTIGRHPATAVAVCVALAALTAVAPDGRVILLGTFVAFVALAVALDLLIGTTGLLALGHAAFFGGGAYLSTALNQDMGWSFPLSAAASIAAIALLALVIGLPTTNRATGFYFAIITFAFGELMVQLVNNTTSVTGGSEGLSVNWGLGSELPFGWTLDRYFSMWLVGALLVAMVISVVVRSSHFGLRLHAIRESEDLTRGLGFNPTFYKTVIFVVSSSLAALVGVFYAPMVGFLNPELMDVHQSIYLLGLLFVGGLRSSAGAFVGVLLLATVPQYFDLDPGSRPIIVGAAMAVTVLVAPDRGIAGVVRYGLRELGGRVTAGRRGGGSTPADVGRGGPDDGAGPDRAEVAVGRATAGDHRGPRPGGDG